MDGECGFLFQCSLTKYGRYTALLTVTRKHLRDKTEALNTWVWSETEDVYKRQNLDILREGFLLKENIVGFWLTETV